MTTFDDIKLVLYRGYWAAAWRQGGVTKRQSMKTQDRAEAFRRMEAWKQENAAALNVINDIVPAYIDDCRGKVSHSRMEYAWNRLRPFFGAMSVIELDGRLGRNHCRTYTALRRQQVEDGTIIRELTVLRAALYWHDKGSKAEIELPPSPAPRERYLTRDELANLLETAEMMDPQVWRGVQLAYYTAGRIAAVVGLAWSRVDMNRRLADLNDDKSHGNKKRAKVSINDELYELLTSILEEGKQSGILPPLVIGEGVTTHEFRRRFRKVAVKAGLSVAAKDPDKVTPHCLRHSAAVHMAEEGVSIDQIGKFLGHTDYNTTYQTYVQFTPEFQRKAASALHIPKRNRNNVIPLAENMPKQTVTRFR